MEHPIKIGWFGSKIPLFLEIPWNTHKQPTIFGLSEAFRPSAFRTDWIRQGFVKTHSCAWYLWKHYGIVASCHPAKKKIVTSIHGFKWPASVTQHVTSKNSLKWVLGAPMQHLTIFGVGHDITPSDSCTVMLTTSSPPKWPWSFAPSPSTIISIGYNLGCPPSQ